jgi:hypothetical protein
MTCRIQWRKWFEIIIAEFAVVFLENNRYNVATALYIQELALGKIKVIKDSD